MGIVHKRFVGGFETVGIVEKLVVVEKIVMKIVIVAVVVVGTELVGVVGVVEPVPGLGLGLELEDVVDLYQLLDLALDCHYFDHIEHKTYFVVKYWQHLQPVVGSVHNPCNLLEECRNSYNMEE